MSASVRSFVATLVLVAKPQVERTGSLEHGALVVRLTPAGRGALAMGGEYERNRWANIALLTKRDEVTFVPADHADYE